MAATTHILLIEDDDLLLELYGIALASGGYEILKANNGLTGLDLIKSQRPDLVLLDLAMPSFSGFQVLEELKQRKNRTPIIIISNNDDPRAIRKCRDLGAVEYIVKAQTNLEQIKDIVKRTLKTVAA